MLPRLLRQCALLVCCIHGAAGWLATRNLPTGRSPSALLLKGSDGWMQSRSYATPSVRTTMARYASKFSQPAFSQPAFTGNTTARQQTTPQRKNPVVQKYGADSAIASRHLERVRTAGRVGTKRFVDPCKVFFGNLPFNVTEAVLESWLSDRMGLPPGLLLSQVKVIRDWKTSKSKGYGFVVFTEAIHGTVCIDKCNGQPFYGRLLSVGQGKKKDTDPIVFKKKNKAPADSEEAAIQAGMAEASLRLDPMEALMLRQLDPDLVDDDFEKDDGLFDEGELDDDEIDGIFCEGEGDDDDMDEDVENETPMNRERRREAARLRKKKKPVNKGFGA
jgi:hypothetical protein